MRALDMSHSSFRTAFFALCASVVLILCTHTVHSEEPPGPSRMVVGIIPFEYHAAEIGNVEAILKGRLGKYGIEIEKLVKDETSPQELFAEHKHLDFILTGSVTGQGESRLAIAHIHERGRNGSEDLETRGKPADIDLTSEIIAHITSNDAIKSLVNDRKQNAQDRLREDPDDFESLMILGLASAYESEWSLALGHFRDALAIHESDAQVHYNLAICYKHLGDTSNQRLHLLAARDLDRDNEGASIALGNLHLDNGEYGKALGEYEKWTESPKNSSLVHWNLAVLHARRGELGRAKSHLDSIPEKSFYFAAARGWADRLHQRIKRAGDSTQADGQKQSIFGWLNLPESFGTVLLVICLAILLSPYLAGLRLGNVEIPRFASGYTGTLKVLGPIVFLFCLALFIPLLSLPSLEITDLRPVADNQMPLNRIITPPATGD